MPNETQNSVDPRTNKLPPHRRIYHVSFRASYLGGESYGDFIIETDALSSIAIALAFKDDCRQEAREMTAQHKDASIMFTSITRIDS